MSCEMGLASPGLAWPLLKTSCEMTAFIIKQFNVDIWWWSCLERLRFFDYHNTFVVSNWLEEVNGNWKLSVWLRWWLNIQHSLSQFQPSVTLLMFPSEICRVDAKRSFSSHQYPGCRASWEWMWESDHVVHCTSLYSRRHRCSSPFEYANVREAR